MSEIDEILARAAPGLRGFLQEAFDAGRASMKRDLRAVLSLDESESSAQVVTKSNERPSETDDRAAPGTVKPTIIRILESHPNGISAAEILKNTGFKENSIRGTLAALKADGFAERRGELWMKRSRAPNAYAREP